MLSLTVGKHDSEQRLDRWLRKKFPDAGLNFLFAVLRKKKVRVNGIIGKSAQMLSEGDEVSIYENMSQEKRGEVKFEEYSLQNVEENLHIVLLDEDFVILDKQCGVPSQPGSGVAKNSSLSELLEIWGKLKNLDFKPTLVHRLDKDTSGLIIAALSGKALREIGKAIRERSVKKEYLALVKGHLNQKTGKISAPLPGENRLSLTEYTVEKSLEDCDLLRVNLETGRKHQIRIHFAQTGHPLYGDSLHGDFNWNRKCKKNNKNFRLFLHAASLEFHWQGRLVKVQSPLPKELFLLAQNPPSPFF